MNEDKIKALASFKGVDPSDVKVENDEYIIGDEFYVVLDEDEADQALYDDIECLVDDLGLQAFSKDFQEYIIENGILDDWWFEQACIEMEESYCHDIDSEGGDIGATRLIDECIEADIISEDDLNEDGEYTGNKNLEEELAEYIVDDIRSSYSSFAEWYMFDFGDDAIRDLIEDGRVDFDLDEVVRQIKMADGYGPSLASYDGEENYEDGYYIFRIG